MVIDALEYLQRSLDMGKLFLIITHIHMGSNAQPNLKNLPGCK